MDKKIVVKVAAGLGNQMFMYANAYSMAKRFGYKLLIDNTTPPLGVALPVKFVLPADTVIGILFSKQVLKIIAHSNEFFGFTKRLA